MLLITRNITNEIKLKRCTYVATDTKTYKYSPFLEKIKHSFQIQDEDIVSRKGDWSGNPAKSKDFSIVFDYYVGGMLDLAKNDLCTLTLIG